MYELIPREVRQQYGGRAERVPTQLNSPDAPIDITLLPNNIRELLFRDIGLGDALVTEKIARDVKIRAMDLSRLAEQEFKAMLKRLPPLLEGGDLVLYLPID
ncbi:hypothetical protein HYX05_04885 [Candidatus Woesearchaeota archaeon]|nr:hypothetical protein [Candidatus Woesearchaeota archaeon]